MTLLLGAEHFPGKKTAILRDAFVADSAEQARDIAGEAVMGALNFSNWRGPGVYLDPDETLDPEFEVSLNDELTYDFVNDRSLLFGSPEQVVDKLMELWEETHIEQVAFKCSWPGFPHEHAVRSIELLAAEVIPEVNRRIQTQASAAD